MGAYLVCPWLSPELLSWLVLSGQSSSSDRQIDTIGKYCQHSPGRSEPVL